MAGSSHMTRWKRRWRSRNQIPRKHYAQMANRAGAIGAGFIYCPQRQATGTRRPLIKGWNFYEVDCDHHTSPICRGNMMLQQPWKDDCRR